MTTTPDPDRYHALADWAESDAPTIHPDKGTSGPQSQAAAHELLRRAGGRPSVDPAATPGEHSPRRQVRLPRRISDRVDELAGADNRSPSDLMRDAIVAYVNQRDHQPTS